MIQIQLFAHFIFILGLAFFCIQSLLPGIQENISIKTKRLFKLFKGGKDSSEKIIRGNTVFSCRFLTFPPVSYSTLNLVYNKFDLIVALMQTT